MQIGFLKICLLILEEREKHQRGRETLIGCLSFAPQAGIKPRCVPWPQIELPTLWLWDDTPTEPHQPGCKLAFLLKQVYGIGYF